MNLISKLALGLFLLFIMTQLAGIAIDLTLLDLEAQLAEIPPVHPKVTALMKYHGVQFFDWNDELQQYGFYRNGRWCPAK